MDIPFPIPESFGATGQAAWRRGTAPLTQFQVLGERASATNFVRKLIDANLDISRTEGLGWKHAVPHMVAIPSALLCVVVVRNAEKWALSMHARPWHADPALQSLPLANFLRTPWKGIVDRASDFEEIHPEIADHIEGEMLQFDRHPLSGRPFSNLFELRKIKLAGHLGLINRGANVALLRAEAVQDDPETTIEFLSRSFDLARLEADLHPVRRRLGARFNPTGRDRQPAKHHMSADDIAFMRAQLDLPLETALGYDYVTPLAGHAPEPLRAVL